MRRPQRLLTFLLLGVGAAVFVLVLRHDAGTVLGLSSHDFSRLALLLAVLIFVGAGFIVRHMRAGEVLQAIAFWFMALAILVGLYAFRDDLAMLGGRFLGALVPGVPVTGRLSGESDPQAVVIMRSSGGHFSVRAEADGQSLRFLVDTGASFVTLTEDDATKIGIDPDTLTYVVPVQTANGTIRAASIRIASLAIGPIERHDLRALVAPAGSLEQSLLGLNFLDTLRGFSISGDRLVLTP